MATQTVLVKNMLLDGFGRIHQGVSEVLDGLDLDDLRWRPEAEANPIGWLIWHLTRQQDAQLAHLRGDEAVWADWRGRFSLPYPPDAHGYGMSSADVGRFTVNDPQLLGDYQSATHDATTGIIDRLSADEFERVLDGPYQVTVAVRLYSVLEDATKHLGQAEYLRGMIGRK